MSLTCLLQKFLSLILSAERQKKLGQQALWLKE